MTGEPSDPVPATVPFWRKPVSIFGLFLMTALIESAPVCPIPSSQPRLRLMLAETPLPHGFGASRVTVGTLSRGHSTARYLAALPRRILLMEQQVWSIQLARQSTLRHRVAERHPGDGKQRPVRRSSLCSIPLIDGKDSEEIRGVNGFPEPVAFTLFSTGTGEPDDAQGSRPVPGGLRLASA